MHEEEYWLEFLVLPTKVLSYLPFVWAIRALYPLRALLSPFV
jgi:hypothetical protein